MKKKRLSIFMLVASIVCSALYYYVVKTTGASTQGAATVLIEPKDATMARVDVTANAVVIEPSTDEVLYYCLVTKEAFDKMSGFGMTGASFLTLGNAVELAPGKNTIESSNAFMVMNYVKIVSDDIEQGKKFRLMIGCKDANGEFTDRLTESIKIEP